MGHGKSITGRFYYFKAVGLVLVLAGIVIAAIDRSPGSEVPLLVGLFMVLVVTSKNEDERSSMIKSSSLYAAFALAYGAKLLVTNLFEHQLIQFQLVEINHFLILVLTLANLIHYARMLIIKV